MKGVVLKYGILFSLVIGSGAVLMDISQHVQSAERDIKHYNRRIANEEEAIRVLKAEWAYLNDPARLERLASKGLGLQPIDALSMVSGFDSFNASVFPPIKPSVRAVLYRDISYVPSPHTISPIKKYSPIVLDRKNGEAQ